jgi:LytS/YehU family sensor histidine kinase
MTNVKKLIALVHILPWTYAALMFSWEFFVEGHPVRPRSFSIGVYVFYAHLFIFQKYLGKKKYKQYFTYLSAILLTGQIPYLLFLWLRNEPTDSSVMYLLTSIYWADATFFLFNSIIVAAIGALIVNTIKKEELLKHAINTELVYLKSQINPHFLFNTLNNIHTLVYMQAPAAPEAVMRLSSLMRYMLYESNATAVPLLIELNYLKDYIGLQQLRYKANDVVDFRVDGNVERYQVAPLLFVHLLENAYKHSPAKLETGSIKVNVSVKGNSLVFSCHNPVGNKIDNLLEEQGGIGLANVQKRLQLLYPEKHNLEIDKTETHFSVQLKINVKQSNERKAELLYN